MKGLQGERLRQAFRYFDENQDGFIRTDQFKRIILVRHSRALFYLAVIMTLSPLQELAGHKLSDAVIELLPTITALTPGGRISFSEVIACHNVIRGMCTVLTLDRPRITFHPLAPSGRDGHH